MDKILLIDNYDSFTYNLLHLVKSQYSGDVVVLRNNEVSMDNLYKYNAIIISPGPGRPKTTPTVMNILKKVQITTPILGICLGMQCINEFFDGTTERATNPIHGKVSKLKHFDNNGIFKNIPQGINIARYHSLIINPSKHVKITGYSDNGVIMAIQHKEFPIFGLQFHPESFLCEYGDIMMRNFLEVSDLI